VSALVDKVRSRGYWDVVIRPEVYEHDRIPYSQLDEIVAAVVVRMRGWPVPLFDYRQDVVRGRDWVGQDIDADLLGHYEAWRFHRSGQFNHLRAVGADWRGSARISPGSAASGEIIEVWEVLFYLTEIFELAARLALSAAGNETMTIEAGLHGLGSRRLVVGQHNRTEFLQPYRASHDDLTQRVTVSREELVAEPRGRAVDMAHEFFVRFGWKPSRDQLTEHQRELTERDS
jgi:hypothetical protein